MRGIERRRTGVSGWSQISKLQLRTSLIGSKQRERLQIQRQDFSWMVETVCWGLMEPEKGPISLLHH